MLLSPFLECGIEDLFCATAGFVEIDHAVAGQHDVQVDLCKTLEGLEIDFAVEID